MALRFPSNPALGEVYEDYEWRGSYWARIHNSSTSGSSVSTSSDGTHTHASLQPTLGTGSNNTLINLTIPIDLGQLMHGADHAHSDFDYLAPE